MVFSRMLNLFVLIAYAFTLLFPFRSAAGEPVAGQLYLVPEFENIALADAALNLVQCAFTRANWMIEVSDQADAGYPQLYLKEIAGKAVARLLYAKNQSTELGAFSAAEFGSALCEKVLVALKNPPQPEAGPVETTAAAELSQKKNELARLAPPGPLAAATTPTALGDTSSGSLMAESTHSSFLSRNWPYIAIAAAAIVGGFFLLKPHDAAAPTAQNVVSRGFTTR